jgi:PAS domain S-box-containing protein
MIMVDRRGTIHLVNALTEQLLGYRRDELVGQSVDRLVPARFGATHDGFRAAFFADSRQRPMGEGRELYALRKDGTEVAVEIGLSPVETADGPFVLAAVSDITERKRSAVLLQQALEAERAAKREAEHANALKDQFLATVSHELRGPLNAILGWAEMLRGNVLEGTRRQKAFDAIYNNAKRQSQLIDDLLDVARIVAGHMRVERTAVNLQAVIRSALDALEPSAQAKRIAVSVDVDESIGLILGDAARLQQVVSNLLTNAIKFTPEGGAIHVGTRRADGFVDISVADNGEGMTTEFIPRAFEPFRQADASSTRAHGGLGLGLAIVKHLVEAHDGTVRCESAGKGQGATFTVRLPIVAVYSGEARSDEAARPMASRTSLAAPTATALSGITVLVVDDDHESRELLTVTLETYGAGVVTAASAADAVQALGAHSVHVLLSDIAMPGEDGYSVIRAIRAHEASWHSHLPAAALTSFTGDDDRQRALKAGFDAHLAKPIDAHSLIEAVAALARGVRTPQRASGQPETREL